MTRHIGPPETSGPAGERLRTSARASGRNVMVAVVLPFYIAWQAFKATGRALDSIVFAAWRTLRAAIDPVVRAASGVAAALSGVTNAWAKSLELLLGMLRLVVAPLVWVLRAVDGCYQRIGTGLLVALRGVTRRAASLEELIADALGAVGRPLARALRMLGLSASRIRLLASQAFSMLGFERAWSLAAGWVSTPVRSIARHWQGAGAVMARPLRALGGAARMTRLGASSAVARAEANLRGAVNDVRLLLRRR